jgi:opacity protein-like surface antigen
MNNRLKLFATTCILAISSNVFAGGIINNWDGYYWGINPSATVTNITNSNNTAHGFTDMALGLNIAALKTVAQDLLLGGEVDLNTGLIRQGKFKNSPTSGNFRMENRNRFFGSLLLVAGTAINAHFGTFVNGGVGFLKAKTTGVLVKDGESIFSDHSRSFVMPVAGGGLIYKSDNNCFAKANVRYYIPISNQYYSTVGEGTATLRKGLLQTGLEIGKKWD